MDPLDLNNYLQVDTEFDFTQMNEGKILTSNDSDASICCQSETFDFDISCSTIGKVTVNSCQTTMRRLTSQPELQTKYVNRVNSSKYKEPTSRNSTQEAPPNLMGAVRRASDTSLRNVSKLNQVEAGMILPTLCQIEPSDTDTMPKLSGPSAELPFWQLRRQRDSAAKLIGLDESVRPKSRSNENLLKLLQELKDSEIGGQNGDNGHVDVISVEVNAAQVVSEDSRRRHHSIETGELYRKSSLRATSSRSSQARIQLSSDSSVDSSGTPSRKNSGKRGSVKFADNFGLILNTFAMVPSSRVLSSKNLTSINPEIDLTWKPLPSADDSVFSITFNSGDKTKPNIFRTDSFDTGFNSDEDYLCASFAQTIDCRASPVLELKHGAERKLKKGAGLPHLNCHRMNDLEKEEYHSSPDLIGASKHFKLRFHQPIADPIYFMKKLQTKCVSLENVRVEECAPVFSPSPSGPLSPSNDYNSATIYCSIKVLNLAMEKRVFARCTDDHWVTYADLPAQFLPDVCDLGYEFDTFCFALRRPIKSSGIREVPPKLFNLDDRKPQSIVEFAICYQVDNESYWDNNEGHNYRVDWF